LRSVASQTGVEIEHVVCDGGSTDNTVEFLNVLAHQGIGCRRKTRGNYAHAVVRRAFLSAEMRKTVYSWMTF
jgi:glycosyltransferase involved in cell wall biosynthesis